MSTGPGKKEPRARREVHLIRPAEPLDLALMLGGKKGLHPPLRDATRDLVGQLPDLSWKAIALHEHLPRVLPAQQVVDGRAGPLVQILILVTRNDQLLGATERLLDDPPLQRREILRFVTQRHVNVDRRAVSDIPLQHVGKVNEAEIALEHGVSVREPLEPKPVQVRVMRPPGLLQGRQGGARQLIKK